ncbi:MAG TPA: ATP-binding protein [Mycobacterium sp.]|nr:ATP-binding protein [Mycobacterium sp.]
MAPHTHSRPLDFLRIEVPATADRLAEIRRRLLAWLEPIAVSAMNAADIVLAVNEACTNSVEHAYRHTDRGVVRVEAGVEGGQIVVRVADFGVWQPPSRQPSTRGRGLPIMHAMSDRVELDTSPTGTTVRMSFDSPVLTGGWLGGGTSKLV